MANLNPKRTKRCNQSSLVGTLKGTTPRHRPLRYAAFGKRSKRTTPDTVLQGMWPSARVLNGRPPDTVLEGMRPSARVLSGRPPDTVLQSMRPSARVLNGRPPDTALQGMRSHLRAHHNYTTITIVIVIASIHVMSFFATSVKEFQNLDLNKCLKTGCLKDHKKTT